MLTVTSFKSQRETKIKIHGKVCQIWVDTSVMFSTLDPTFSGACRWDLAKTGRSQ